jgi:hypothetical protein
VLVGESFAVAEDDEDILGEIEEDPEVNEDLEAEIDPEGEGDGDGDDVGAAEAEASSHVAADSLQTPLAHSLSLAQLSP